MVMPWKLAAWVPEHGGGSDCPPWDSLFCFQSLNVGGLLGSAAQLKAYPVSAVQCPRSVLLNALAKRLCFFLRTGQTCINYLQGTSASPRLPRQCSHPSSPLRPPDSQSPWVSLPGASRGQTCTGHPLGHQQKEFLRDPRRRWRQWSPTRSVPPLGHPEVDATGLMAAPVPWDEFSGPHSLRGHSS